MISAEIAEDGEHAQVVRGPVAEPELGEDPRHMTLDGGHGYHQLIGNAVIGSSLGHQAENLPLAIGQVVDRVVLVAASDEPADDLSIDHRAARGDAPDRVGEDLDLGYALLEQVADALGLLL
jgi:hypothetical protein